MAASQLRQDVTYALRMLRKNAGFTTVAVTTLALGIGANTAIFSVVDTVVFRPLPYKDPGRLVKIYGRQSAGPVDDVSLPDFVDLREQRGVFEQVAADDGMGFRLTHADGLQESVNGGMVTADWLFTLGVQPILGRGFLEEESAPGRDRVLILSHGYWQRRYGSDRNAIGKTLSVDGVPFTIVGVLPPNVLRYSADFIKPLVAAEYPGARSHRDLDVVARLRPSVTLAQAQGQLDALARRLEHDYPATNKGRGFRVAPLDKYYASIQRNASTGLLLMLGAVGLVLLIACANVANLLLVRAVGRYRECVIRAALGATRARLVRQMLIENMCLFLIGGALGVIVAQWSVDSLARLAIAGNYLPERLAVAVDGRVFAFTLIVSLLAGASFGLAPAVQASRVDVNQGLKGSAAAIAVNPGRRRATRLLIVSELALSLVLLVGFGLLTRSFLRVHATSAGFTPDNLLVTASDGGRVFAPAVAFWRAALEAARRDPGAEFAAVSSRPPVHGVRQHLFTIEGRAVPFAADNLRAGDVLVSADYFRATGIPVLQGRAFTEHDDGAALPVVVISDSLARRFFPNENPIGRRLSINERSPMICCSAARPVEGVWREIVGVAGDIRQGNLDEPPALTLYRPFTQIVEHDMFLLVRARSRDDAARIARTLRPQLIAVDPAKEWGDVRPMQDVIDGSESIRLRRFVLILLGTFAGLALLLAGVGTYGVMASSVAERTREIGIRMALGATRPVVLTQVLGESLKLALAGLIVGLVAAQLLSRFIASMLFGVSATDLVTYGGVSVLLVGAALLASYLPARRATRLDPLVALRHE